jgi:hypothetical protein
MKSITPLKNYNAPCIPTLEAARETPALLKKLPQRWKKNLSVAACLGFAGLVALSSCGTRTRHGENMPESSVASLTEDELRERIEAAQEAYAAALEVLESAPLELRAHGGGSMSGPFYTVYFTEQEAFGFIRAHLEVAGFNFDATPPEDIVTLTIHHTDEMGGVSTHHVGLELFDAQKGVAIAEIQPKRDYAEQVEEALAEHFNNLRSGVFYNPGEFLFNGSNAEREWAEKMWEEHGDESMDRWTWIESASFHPIYGKEYEAMRNEKVEELTPYARLALIANLTAQANDFINLLKSEGVH